MTTIRPTTATSLAAQMRPLVLTVTQSPTGLRLAYVGGEIFQPVTFEDGSALEWGDPSGVMLTMKAVRECVF